LICMLFNRAASIITVGWNDRHIGLTWTNAKV
jgi:hypothetical protein